MISLIFFKKIWVPICVGPMNLNCVLREGFKIETFLGRTQKLSRPLNHLSVVLSTKSTALCPTALCGVDGVVPGGHIIVGLGGGGHMGIVLGCTQSRGKFAKITISLNSTKTKISYKTLNKFN